MGAGPLLVLLHGAGGSCHSWRHLMPLLAADHRVVAIDLPGQGFTRRGNPGRAGLEATAEDIAALCAAQGWTPAALIGHSAGAAIALRLAQTLSEPPRAVIGINAALGRFEGVAGWLFPVLAKILSVSPFVPRLFARLNGTEAAVARLLGSTGSRIEPAGLAQYRRLIGDPDHVDATLAMMAQWRLDPLLAALPALDVPCLLIAGENDRTVPPAVSRRAAERMPQGRLAALPGTGHLAHEEDADAVAALMRPFLSEALA